MTATLDPVAAHVAELDRVLSGPERIRRSMIDEVRDGLRDAEAAHRCAGLDPHRAALQAVREFGTVPEVAPLMQEELTARQGRWAMLLFVVAFPTIVNAWDMLWWVHLGWQAPAAPPAVLALAHAQAAVSWSVTAAAVVLLLATFRCRASRRITTAAGIIGVLGAGACILLTVAIAVVHPSGVADLLTNHPLGLPVVVCTNVLLGLVSRSAVCALRVGRRAGS